MQSFRDACVVGMSLSPFDGLFAHPARCGMRSHQRGLFFFRRALIRILQECRLWNHAT